MFGYSACLKTSIEYLTFSETLLRFMDVITTTVSPTLPTALTIGVLFAINRLKEKQIYCISPNKVDAAGRVSRVVFDKTGTLTEDSLNVAGHRIMHAHNNFSHLIEDITLNYDHSEEFWKSKSHYSMLKNQYKVKYLECMAACHMIVKIDDAYIGDPLDVEMFKSTAWVMNESRTVNQSFDATYLVSFFPKSLELSYKTNEDLYNLYRMGIIKRFDFSPSLQCMSVVACSNYDDSIMCFVKGSPEKIESIAIPSSIPSNYAKILQNYTQDGLRVISLSYKCLENTNFNDAKKLKREDVEKDVIFLGFLILQNKVKSATMRSLGELQKADIATIMATGDNGLTAVSVARD